LYTDACWRGQYCLLFFATYSLHKIR
jgi:hypothetical protein